MGIYKLVEIISYSNSKSSETFLDNLQISRNYKLFKPIYVNPTVCIYKLVEIISYSNELVTYRDNHIYKLVEIISYSNKQSSSGMVISTN